MTAPARDPFTCAALPSNGVMGVDVTSPPAAAVVMVVTTPLEVMTSVIGPTGVVLPGPTVTVWVVQPVVQGVTEDGGGIVVVLLG